MRHETVGARAWAGAFAVVAVFAAGCSKQEVPAASSPSGPVASATVAKTSPRVTAPRSTAAPNDFAVFVGHWAGHGRALTINEDRTGRLLARTYQRCGDPDVSPPCDTVADDEIKSGIDEQLKITGVRATDSGPIADFIVVASTATTPPDTKGTLTLDTVNDAVGVVIGAGQQDLYCGTKAPPGYCGA